jgi:hypothetical protein
MDSGMTVSCAVDVPLYVAVIIGVAIALTLLVATVNVAVVAPEATVTLLGTVATVVSLLASATTVPPAGAALMRVAVPVEEVPPVTVVGLT